MTLIVPRTCTAITERDDRRNVDNAPQPLDAFQSVPAYVLLGDPGAGKTTSFKKESEHTEDGFYITARDFLAFDVHGHPEWRNKTLSIDGLDEVRAGKSDTRVPFDAIRTRLDALGKPRFRLSCREADWLGNNDLENLKKVSPDGRVISLRLDPLKETDIERILESHPRIDDAAGFILKARGIGIDGLLENPQTLELMVTAVASGGMWPQSRLDTFEIACGELAKEHNEEHEAAADSRSYSPDQILHAAGRLCALMLISGALGCRLRHNQAGSEYVTLDQCEYEHPEHLKAALASKLFKADSEGRFVPVHRHVAEFLAGRHLAKIIDGEDVRTKCNGLPGRRVIALLTGEDGMVVSELRGLSAWLAAHSAQARRELITRDPTGVGLYGDISNFTINEKFALLESLRNEWTKADTMIRSEVSAFTALVTPDMATTIKNVLTNAGREMEDQRLTEFVLRVLAHSDRSIDFSNTLYGMIRDETRWLGVRLWALKSFIRFETDDRGTDTLKSLLRAMNVGKLAYPDRELVETLLTRLYPGDLPPSEVWCYLTDSGGSLRGNYQYFWQDKLVKISTDDQIVELLDSLSVQIEKLYPAFEYHNLFSLPIQLLARGLQVCGDDIEPDRLYDWLGVACDRAYRRVSGGRNAYQAIGAWLAQRPAIQKAVVLESLTRYDESEERRHHTFIVGERLYNTKPPEFAVWCLQQAAEKKDVNPKVAEYLLETAILDFQYAQDDSGLTRSMLEEFVRAHESFRTKLEKLLAPPTIEEMYREEEAKVESEHLEREDKWIQKVRESETALRENLAEPALLSEIAQTYFDYSIDFRGLDGCEKIQDRLRGDQHLTDAAVQGLIDTVNRGDVPESNTILDLYAQDQEHFLSWPYLAGLSVIERQDPEDVVRWDEAKCRTALAFHYCSAQYSYQPRWYLWLLINKPELVSEVLTITMKSDFRRAKDRIQRFHMLANDRNHAHVARLASLGLLQSFPIRCNRGLIPSLENLLCSAMKHADRTMFRQLIENKLSRKSMNVAQQARWLAAGILMSPGKYEDRLINFVQIGRGYARTASFAETLCMNECMRSKIGEMQISTLKTLISVIGRAVRPDEKSDDTEQRSVTAVTDSSTRHVLDFVDSMIYRLGSIPTAEATDALTTLVTDEALSYWHYGLNNRLVSQRTIRRNEEYRHPSVYEISQTLKGGTPANAGDLAALVMDRLIELATTIRDGNTDDWRQYWNLPHGQPKTPRHEDHCRDTLLSDLQQRLPQDIDAQPEGQYANDKRADMRIAFQNFQVPVEVKKNNHRELWSAMHNQLIKQYVRDPATDGYGIYLVFWFGEDYTQAPPEGKLPDSTLELQERLTATLSPEEARKISVCVIDVSPN